MSSKNIYSSPLCSCIYCRKQTSSFGIHSHYLTSHTVDGNARVRKSSYIGNKKGKEVAASINALNKKRRIDEYELNPAYCITCNIKLPFHQKNNKFCSHSCAAKTGNKTRQENGWVVTQEQKNKTSASVKAKHASKPKKIKIYKCIICDAVHESKILAKACCSANKSKRIRFKKQEIEGPYSKIFYCSCKHCGLKFISKSAFQFCINCKEHHSNKRSIYRFKFNVYHYPDLFDLGQLTNLGFYSPGGKSGAWNINGMSRDHKVSIAEAIKNNYDPYYISHPCNCELMPHKENGKKRTKSSITYQELIKLVDDYDSAKLIKNTGGW